MSSNIGPEARAAYEKYLEASSLEEKIERLERFVSLVPKHKATENIVALNKTKLAKLRKQLDERKKKSTAKVVSPFSIKKEGIQMILLSDYNIPGVGKTSLLNYLTGAAEETIGRFNALPEIGIYEYKGIRFQVVDMPSLMEGASRGKANGKEILAQVRACDLICICVDLSRNVDQQITLILNELNNADIKINKSPPAIDIEKTGSNNIQVFFLTKESKNHIELSDEIKEIVADYGIQNAIVKVYGDITLIDVYETLNPSLVYKKAIIIATKGDLPQTEEKFELLKEKYSDKFPIIIGSSVKKSVFPEDFGEKILDFLHKIKIYTMDADGISDKPLLLTEGSKVKDAALKIHRSFVDNFEFATIIREGAKQKRKRVGLDYELKDGDALEIHTY
ncbi:MAG: GTPase Obg [Promethearchaeota archaeon]|nr:MAG: GTPase Obg [Candidatus Lokiarchaeota archaeon]